MGDRVQLPPSMPEASNRLGRAWRLVGTALSFAAFGIGGIVLGLIVIPVACLLTPPGDRRRVARFFVGGAFAVFVNLMRFLRVLDYRIEGVEGAGDLSGCLIVANHPSLIDVVFLLAIFRHADCVVKHAHWSNPFTMGPIRWADYIPNRDPQSLIERAVERLKGGGHLVMFPEGTRTVPGQPLDLRRGAATVAVTARARCLPIFIRCTPTTLTKAEPWYYIPRRRVLFEVIVQEPIPADEVAPRDCTPRQAAIALTQRLTATFEALRNGSSKPSEPASAAKSGTLAINDQEE